MKTTLLFLIAIVSVFLVVLVIELSWLRRARTAQQAHSNMAPLHALAQVSIDRSFGAVPNPSVPRLVRAEVLGTQRLPGNDSIESMRVYRERVEAMKRSGSFQTLPTLEPSKVEALMEANQ